MSKVIVRITICALCVAAIVISYWLGYQSGQSGDDPRIVATAKAQQQKTAKAPRAWSPTKPFPVQTVYYPGTEGLGPDEMRVIACGTGMPQPRLKQAAACFLVELRNVEFT